ncbi:hypothetical protein [Candidatus Thiodiazotropha endoloripes]|uniref:hypothetical protein n=1 Tax=Candidatus Thiodiazotropha endoloripes TaxID=1818881 RepID=UPI0009F4954C|nr:hypothetical protein [Candidatus Thiodiazotropha endoloripes]
MLNPATLALLLVSILVSMMLLVATAFAFRILHHWDIQSGSELQLRLERGTYLVSTLLIWAFLFEFLSLLLFIYNAEALSGQFVGAMCATGVLNLNPWGWPTLFLKITMFFVAVIWLVLNYLDNQGYDYPLIRFKYALLLLALPLVIGETIVQWLHFTEMEPNLITSCCGTLFSADAQGVSAEVSGIAPAQSIVTLAISAILVIAAGVWVALRGWGGWLLSIAAIVAFVVAILAIISSISLYIYEHPHHHCPFCILKQGHGYVGYFLYIPLFLATSLALSAGFVSPWRKILSLSHAVADLLPVLSWLSQFFFIQFYLTAAWSVWFSRLTMMEVWW